MTQRAADDLQRLLAEEPFVRGLARQLVGTDADEVVQQTWLRAVEQGGGGVQRPRSWLARIVRNVAANLRRDDRRRRERQEAAAVKELVPSSAELMEREERRRALVAAVDALPPSLRTAVLLRWFEGLPPRRIAAKLGVPVATVWTWLHRAFDLLRQRLDDAHGGDRRAWLLPLVGFARPPAAPAWPALPWITGAIAMTTKTKIVAAAAVLLAATFAVMLWPGQPSPASYPADKVTEPPALPVHAGMPQAANSEPLAEAATERKAVEPEAETTVGRLVVHVRYSDHTPAPDRVVIACLSGQHVDSRVAGQRVRTDATGTAELRGLPPGRTYLTTAGERHKPFEMVEIQGGKTTEIDYELDAGLRLFGIVVDADAVPVAGALVEATMVAHAGMYPEIVATTGADGRFEARAVWTTSMVGARAPGHTASLLKYVFGKDGNTAEVRLVLGPNGGCVDGTVMDERGVPVAGTAVIVGRGELSGIGGRDDAPPFPALVRSDAEGRFLAVGVPVGEQPVQARAPGLAPWQGTCTVAAGLTTSLRVTLAAGARLQGTVLDAEGKPLQGAEVRVGDWHDLALYRTRSAADGAFGLAGLPPGEVELLASHDDAGKCTQRVRVDASAPTECELRLSRGLECKGVVLDADGQPVPKLMLECLGENKGKYTNWFTFAQTDAKGWFAIANCPDQGQIIVTVSGSGIEQLQQKGIDPKAGEIVLRVKRTQPASVRITGTVVGADGKPVANAHVECFAKGARGSGGLHPTSDAGRFEIGPLGSGLWRVLIRSNDWPEYTSEPRELAADSTWDLGTVTLVRGGRALVKQTGAIDVAHWFFATDAADGRFAPVHEVGGQFCTDVLAPGEYRLMVSGKEVAAQGLPFTIRAGEETAVEVQLQRGVLQRFEIPLPDGVNAGDVRLRVQRGGECVGHPRWLPGEPHACELCLLPGEYSMTATAGERTGKAAFTVGTSAGESVRIEVR